MSDTARPNYKRRFAHSLLGAKSSRVKGGQTQRKGTQKTLVAQETALYTLDLPGKNVCRGGYTGACSFCPAEETSSPRRTYGTRAARASYTAHDRELLALLAWRPAGRDARQPKSGSLTRARVPLLLRHPTARQRPAARWLLAGRRAIQPSSIHAGSRNTILGAGTLSSGDGSPSGIDDLPCAPLS